MLMLWLPLPLMLLLLLLLSERLPSESRAGDKWSVDLKVALGPNCAVAGATDCCYVPLGYAGGAALGADCGSVCRASPRVREGSADAWCQRSDGASYGCVPEPRPESLHRPLVRPAEGRACAPHVQELLLRTRARLTVRRFLRQSHVQSQRCCGAGAGMVQER